MFKNLLILILVFVQLDCLAQSPWLQDRQIMELKEWSFRKGKLNYAEKFSLKDNNWEKVKLPHTYSMDAIEDIGYYKGHAWYRTVVEVPTSMSDGKVFLRFEAIGQEAEVYVNEKKVGKHIGAYSAFCYDITEHVRFGKSNLIAVNVNNAPSFKRIPVNDNLFNIYGGIYRPAYIFSTPKSNISPLHYASSGVFIELLENENNLAKLKISTHVNVNPESKEAAIEYTIKDADGKVVHSIKDQLKVEETNQVLTSIFEIKNPVLWQGRENPHIYTAEVKLRCDDTVDKVIETFGIRSFSFDPNYGCILNGEPYRLYGVCMHQEWEQVGPALLYEHHVKDMDLVDEIGATALRLSHYQHSEIVYNLADRKGIVAWAEIPFVHDYSGREGENAKHQLTELILQNYNHPSIFVWGLWNEVRAYHSPTEPCVGLTKELNEIAHKLDKTRLTTSASDRGMESNMGNISDLQAWNKYFGWYYGDYEDMAEWCDNSHKDYPNRPIGISEYGIGGNIHHQDALKLEKPVGNFFPEMEQTMYHELTWKIIKDRPFLWGTFVWNMFDFSVAGWNRGGIPSLNHKGLITFDRKTKKDAFYFYKANWSDEDVLYIAERRNDDRNSKSVSVKVYTNTDEVKLTINDKKVATKRLKSDINIITFDNVELILGDNVIAVESTDKKLKDEVKWTLLK